MLADGGYTGKTFADSVHHILGTTVEIARLFLLQYKFVVLFFSQRSHDGNI